MLIQQLLTAPGDVQTHMLRYVNNESPSGYHSRFPRPYHPFLCEDPSFSLPFVELCATDTALLTTVGTFEHQVRHVVFHDDRVRLHLHPLMWVSYGDALLERLATGHIGHVAVCPTGSARTVRTLTTPSVAIKLQYDGHLGRVSRGISRTATEYVHAISNDLHAVIQADDDSSTFGFLDEPVTVHYQLSKDSGIGVVYRSTTPTPPFSPGSILIPGYALWSINRRHRDHAPILQQIVEVLGRPAETTVTDLILRPLFTAYLTLATQYGLAPEAHGQNTYLELTPNLDRARIVFQGLESFLYDPEVRHARHLPVRDRVPHVKYLDGASPQRFKERSWYFDEKLCGYFASAVVDCATRTLGVSSAALIANAAEICDEILSWLPYSYLPADAYRQLNTGKYSTRQLEPCVPVFRKATHVSV